jgi:hypothetical protein
LKQFLLLFLVKKEKMKLITILSWLLIAIGHNATLCSEQIDTTASSNLEHTLKTLQNSPQESNTADIIVFSYKRPMQLYALLESLEKYVTGLQHKIIIYRADDEDYEQSYRLVEAHFNDVLFVRQSPTQPHADFKPLLLQMLTASTNDFIIFATDDDIVKDSISISQCTYALQKTAAYGFYLRLGKNVNYCYMWNRPQTIPLLVDIGYSMFAWPITISKFISELDWAYPNTVDMTLYPKEKIKDALHAINYNNPSTLEACWFDYAHSEQPKIGLCFEQSKVINIPINKVQDVLATNRSMDDDAENFHKLFKAGFKVDIQPFHQWHTNAVHAECTFNFIPR